MQEVSSMDRRSQQTKVKLINVIDYKIMFIIYLVFLFSTNVLSILLYEYTCICI